MAKVTLQPRDGLVGITFPADTQALLGLEPGQDFTVIETDDGFRLVRDTTRQERHRTLAIDVLREQSDVLEELAKR